MTTHSNDPLVSVIIPTRNRSKFLLRAITSVLKQDYSNIECIVVDDASTDNTKAVALAFSDVRILYLRNQVRLKATGSRNRGIKAAKGQYIGFLDDDDEWLPNKLEKQVRKFCGVSKKVGVIYGGFFYCSESKKSVVRQVWPKHKGDTYKKIIISNFLGSPTPLIRNECFKKVGGFDERLPSCQDWDLWIRLAKYYEFDFVNDILAKHYIHGDQISNDLKAKISAREILLRKFETDLKQKPFVIGRHLKRLGQLYFLDGRYQKGRQKIFGSFLKNPLQPDIYHHIVLSSLPSIYRKILNKYYVTRIENTILFN